MHLVEDASGMDEDEDEDTRECKKLFKNMKFFLSREVSLCSILSYWSKLLENLEKIELCK